MLLFYVFLTIISFTNVLIEAEYDITNEGSALDIGRNLTIVVYIDGTFLGDELDTVMTAVKQSVIKIKVDYLKHSSIKVKYWNRNKGAISADVSIIVLLATCAEIWQIYQRLHNNDLLFIAITDLLCPRLPSVEAITIPLVRPGQELSQLLLDFRSTGAINWKSASILYDKSLDDDDVESIVEALTKDVPIGFNTGSTLVTLHSIIANNDTSKWISNTHLRKLMKRLSQYELNQNLLVISDYEMISAILDIAKTEKILDSEMQCLFVVKHVDKTIKDFSGFTSQLDEGENIAFVYNTTDKATSCVGGVTCYVRELLDGLGLALMKSIGDELELSKQVSDEEWDAIKPSKADRRDTLLNFVSARIRHGASCDNCTRWEMSTAEMWGQIYLGAKTTRLLPVGSWNPLEGPVLSDELFPHSKHGFRLRKLPIATFHFPPWQILSFNESGHVTEYKGLVFEIVNLLAKNLNFTYELIVPTNTTLSGFTNTTKLLEHSVETMEGEQDESALIGVWDKIVEAVRNKKVFLGACAFTVTDARKSVINFTLPISTEPYVFLLSRPKELSRALLFMSPFTTSTWFCIVAAILLMTPLLCIMNRWSPYYTYNSQNSSKNSTSFNSLMSCFWYIYGALLQQGGGALPAADSSRLVIGTWWLVVLVVVTTYSGNLVAFLTFPKMDKLITNVDELLLKKDSITWGIPANSTLQQLLKRTDDVKLHEMYKSSRLHRTLSEDLKTSVREGKHIYIQRKTSLLYLMKHEYMTTNSCHYALGNEEFLSEHLAMAMMQGSPYLKIINKEIGRMHRVGLITKWLQDYLPKKDRCSAVSAMNEVTNHKVNLDDMQGSFFVLLFGFIGSFVLISTEFLIRQYFIFKEKRIVQPFVS